jgi:hypothetical protein
MLVLLRHLFNQKNRNTLHLTFLGLLGTHFSLILKKGLW